MLPYIPYVSMFIDKTSVYDSGGNTVSTSKIWSAVALPMSALQDEIRIVANIFIIIIAVLLAIRFIGDCIYLAASTSMIGSTHDKSWAYKGMLKTILFLMIDGAAWVIANFIVLLALEA